MEAFLKFLLFLLLLWFIGEVEALSPSQTLSPLPWYAVDLTNCNNRTYHPFSLHFLFVLYWLSNNATAAAAARVSLKHRNRTKHAHMRELIGTIIWYLVGLLMYVLVIGFIYLTYRDRGYCTGICTGAEHYCAPFSFHLGYHLNKTKNHSAYCLSLSLLFFTAVSQ